MSVVMYNFIQMSKSAKFSSKRGTRIARNVQTRYQCLEGDVS